MVRKLIHKFPLRRCECGGKAHMCCYDFPDGTLYFVSCQRFTCNRMQSHFYKRPFIAAFMWNVRNWKYSKQNKKIIDILKGDKHV